MADKDFALQQHVRATKPRRELYIGNCSESMTVESLGTFLAGAIKKLGLGDDPLLKGTSVEHETPILRCSIGASSKFAFLEMRTVQICANCLLLTGIEFQNQTLKVMRPKAFSGLDTGPSMSLDWGRISTVAASIRGLSALSVLAGEMAKSTQPGLVLMAAAAASQIPGAVAPSSAALASAKKEGVSDMAVDAPTLRKNDVTMAPPPSYSATEAAASSAAAVADSSADSLLLVRNIPASVEQEQVKMLLVAFGAIKEGSFMLRPDTSQGGAAGDEKGLEALFCYEDDAVTEGAMVGLRTIKIGEKELAVERVDGSAVATGAAAGGAAGADGGAPGRTLRLLHMCSAEELRTFKEADWKELEGEVRSECSNYGTVASVKSEQSTGAVFVEFGDAAAANSCKGKMNGRTFDGRTIEATIE